MENLIELLKKIITNVLTALYQPFWFAVILTVFLLFFYLYAYKPIDTGKGIRAAFRAWWQEFCRWHHERYDGRGYPDGLKGEEIPIEVQVVSIADVYDALVSERVYKKAYSHKKAVEMILNGECGQFNPLLLECLQDIQDRIDEEFQNVENQSEEENQERKVHDQIMETTVLG